MQAGLRNLCKATAAGLGQQGAPHGQEVVQSCQALLPLSFLLASPVLPQTQFWAVTGAALYPQQS